MDQSLEEKRELLQSAGDDASAQRKAKGVLYAEEVKVRKFPVRTRLPLSQCAAKPTPQRADGRDHRAKARF